MAALATLPMAGSHFHRQVVIGPYIADFACMAAKLIIEVDGSQHGETQEMSHDAVRTKWFEAEGFRVLRYWNNDVSNNIDGVLSDIHTALTERIALTETNGGDTAAFKHARRSKPAHPTPAGFARRPSPSRGG